MTAAWLVAAALVAVPLVGCSSGPSCAEQGGTEVQDEPTLIFQPIFGAKGELLSMMPIFVAHSHCVIVGVAS